MNEQTVYQIRDDERCPYCGLADLAHVGHDEGGYFGGMDCEELRCVACGCQFAVDCDETEDYKAFREANPTGRYRAVQP